jgi:hypothetical protein
VSGNVRCPGRRRLPAAGPRRRVRPRALTASPHLHLVLLGDSIFDNAAYTRGEPDVAAHLRGIVPPAVAVTRVATDGARIRDIAEQIRRIPSTATHLALAVGGNDTLDHFDLLNSRVNSTAEALDLFHTRLARFEAGYRTGLSRVLGTRLPAVVCTIYNGALPDPGEAVRARLALTLFNDAIIRAAWERSCVIVDLRLVCTAVSDYANPIEPSGSGGAKIASALARAFGVRPEGEPSAYSPHQKTTEFCTDYR